VLIFKFCT